MFLKSELIKLCCVLLYETTLRVVRFLAEIQEKPEPNLVVHVLQMMPFM